MLQCAIKTAGYFKLNDGRFGCKICLKPFKNKYHAKEHYEIQHLADKNVKNINCQYPGCDKKFHVEKYMKKHMLEVHRISANKSKLAIDENIKTPEGPVKMDDPGIFKLEDGTGRFGCKICSKSFSSRICAREHYEIQHLIDKNVKNINCQSPGCDKKFYNDRYMKKHMQRIHGISAKTSNSDINKTDLKKHDEKSNENPAKLPKVDTFKAPEEPFKMNDSGIFKSIFEPEIVIDENFKTPEEPFKVDDSEIFKGIFEPKLVIDENIKTAEEPVKTDDLGIFKLEDGTGRFGCQICPKSFAWKKDAKKHYRIRHVEKYMKKQMQRVHGITAKNSDINENDVKKHNQKTDLKKYDPKSNENLVKLPRFDAFKAPEEPFKMNDTRIYKSILKPKHVIDENIKTPGAFKPKVDTNKTEKNFKCQFFLCESEFYTTQDLKKHLKRIHNVY